MLEAQIVLLAAPVSDQTSSTTKTRALVGASVDLPVPNVIQLPYHLANVEPSIQSLPPTVPVLCSLPVPTGWQTLMGAAFRKTSFENP